VADTPSLKPFMRALWEELYFVGYRPCKGMPTKAYSLIKTHGNMGKGLEIRSKKMYSMAETVCTVVPSGLMVDGFECFFPSWHHYHVCTLGVPAAPLTKDMGIGFSFRHLGVLSQLIQAQVLSERDTCNSAVIVDTIPSK